MNERNTLLAVAILAFTPLVAAGQAVEGEHEVTMEVMDDLSDFDADVSDMAGPVDPEATADDDGEARRALEEEARQKLEARFAEIEDDFQHDDVDNVLEDDIDEEDDFEEDEAVDDDALDEVPPGGE